MKKVVSLLIIACIIVLFAMPISAQTEPVLFGIRFDKDSYGVGETLSATIYLTGLAPDVVLGAIGTNLAFSHDDLEFVSGTLFSANADVDASNSGVGHKTFGNKDFISVIVLSNNGFSSSVIYNGQSDTYDIATLTFNVKNPSDGKVSLSYIETSAQGSPLFKTDVLDTNDNYIPYSFFDPAVAEIEKATFDADTAVQEGDMITASPVVYAASPLMVIAKLHTADSGEMIAAPVFKTVDTIGKNELDFSFNYIGNIENVCVTYYFWGVGVNLMKPVLDSVTASVNAG